MAGKTKRAPLTLTDAHRAMLTTLAGSRTAPVREVERAKVLLKYAEGASIMDIRRTVGVSRPTVYKCIDKAVAAGVLVGLKDRFHRPKDPEITPEAKAWVVSLACTKPKDQGLAAELWTLSELAKFVGNHAVASGFPRLRDTNKTTVWRILNERDIKPQRIRYYLERRDPDFERKMHEVLMVYREISLHLQTPTPESATAASPVYTVSVDEKPGVQALGTTAPDLPPVPDQHSGVGRDYEYVRHGTLSILAALDLHTGEIIAEVEPRHRSREFIALLKRLDTHYPVPATIRIVLDNHSSHISKETMAYLATRPGRFEYVHTPKHGSWLNLIECAFSKMARSFLRHIRVSSKDELKQRILKGPSGWRDGSGSWLASSLAGCCGGQHCSTGKMMALPISRLQSRHLAGRSSGKFIHAIRLPREY